MNVQERIDDYIASQPEAKRGEMQQLHDLILGVDPGCKLWFLDGKDASGKVVSNPDIGYGSRDHKYADGTIREFYQIGAERIQNWHLHLYPRYRRQQIPGRNIRQHPRQSDRYRVLHQVQNSKRYKYRRSRSGNTIWI